MTRDRQGPPARLHWVAAAEVGYQAYAPGSGYQFGDSFFADAGFHYRVWPAGEYRPGEVNQVNVFVETNYTAARADSAQGEIVPGSARSLWLLDPGIMFISPLFSVTVSPLLPIAQQVDSVASPFKYGALVTLRLSLFTPHHW